MRIGRRWSGALSLLQDVSLTDWKSKRGEALLAEGKVAEIGDRCLNGGPVAHDATTRGDKQLADPVSNSGHRATLRGWPAGKIPPQKDGCALHSKLVLQYWRQTHGDPPFGDQPHCRSLRS